MGRGKRVRFADNDNDCSLTCKPDDSAIHAKGLTPLSAEDPKTSEYAFFKKLRQDAGRSSHSYPLHKQDDMLKKFESNHCARELTKLDEPDIKRRSMLPVEKHIPIKQISFHSPAGDSRKSEPIKRVKRSNEIRPLLPVELTPVKIKSSHSPPVESRKSGPYSRNMEVFSSKRQKLLQWAAKASSLDIEECRSTGYDLVTVLLQRLVPESNSTEGSQQSGIMRRLQSPELNSGSPLLASSESDIPFMELAQPQRVNYILPITGTGQYLENGSPECWSEKSRDCSFLHFYKEDTNSPITGNANEMWFQHRKLKSDDFLDVECTTKLQTKTESSSGGHHMDTELPRSNIKNSMLQRSCIKRRLQSPKLNSGSPLLASPGADIPFLELSRPWSTNCILPTIGTGKYLEYGSSECWSKKSKECSFLHLNKEDAESLLTGPGNSYRFEHCKLSSDHFVDGGCITDIQTNTKSSFAQHRLDTEFPWSVYEYSALGNRQIQTTFDFSTCRSKSYWESPMTSLDQSNMSSFKEFVEIHDLNDSALKTNLCAQLLGWDDNNLEDEQDLSLYSHNAVSNLDHTRTTEFGDDDGKSLNCKFDVTVSQFSSILPGRQCRDVRLRDICSESYPINTSAGRVLEDRDYQVLVSKYFPVKFSSSHNYLSLPEPTRFRDTFERPSFRDNHPSLNTFEFSAGFNFDPGWKALSLTDSFRDHHLNTRPDLQVVIKDFNIPLLIGDKHEGCFDISNNTGINLRYAGDEYDTDFSSFGFKAFPNKETVYPMLLSESSWDGAVEISCSHSEDD